MKSRSLLKWIAVLCLVRSFTAQVLPVSPSSNALLRAAQNSNFDGVMILVRSGMDPSLQDILGKNALMLILEAGHPDIALSFIKEVKAKLKPVTPAPGPPTEIPLDFVFAVERKNQAFGGADSRGRTPLMIAAANGYTEVARMLVSEGVAVDARNSEGLTAAVIAEREGHPDIVEILTKKVP